MLKALFLCFAWAKEIYLNSPQKNYLIFIKNKHNSTLNYTISFEDIKTAIFNMRLNFLLYNKPIVKGKLETLIDSLINREKRKAIFYLEGKKLGYVNLPIVKYKLYKYKDFLFVNLLKTEVENSINITDKDMKKFYKEHYNRINLSRIKNKSFKKIYEAYKELEQGKSFEEVAQKYTNDIYKKGYIGWVLKKNLPEDILNIIKNIKEGNYSKPFFYNDAWYIVKVNKRIKIRENDYKKYKKDIKESLKKIKLREKEKELLNEYKKKYNIKIFYDVVPKITLKSYPKNAIVALVNGTPIFAYEVYNLMRNTVLGMQAKKRRFHTNFNVNENYLRSKALDILIQKALVSAEAWSRNYEKRYKNIAKKISSFEKEIIANIYINTHILPKIHISEEEIKEYYEKHKKDYKLPKEYLLAVIISRDRNKIEKAYNLLKSGADFYYLASIYNDSPILRENQGILKYIPENKLSREERKYVKKLKIGQFSPIIKKGKFFEIILVKDIKAKNKYYPLSMVKNKIAKRIYQKKYEKLLNETYKHLLKDYDVYINIYQIKKLKETLLREK